MSTDKQLIYEQYQLINEIVLSKANTDRFEKQYNTNHHGATVNIIKFNGCQAYLKNKDIFGYESLDQLRSALEQAAAEMRKRTIKLGGPEAEIVFENDLCIVYWIKTKKAAIKLGRGAKWCTAFDDENLSHNYPLGQGNLFYNYTYHHNTIYYLIDKKDSNKKYGLRVNTDYHIGGVPTMERTEIVNKENKRIEDFGEDNNRFYHRYGLNKTYPTPIHRRYLLTKEQVNLINSEIIDMPAEPRGTIGQRTTDLIHKRVAEFLGEA